MSQLLINDYLKQLDLIKKISGSSRETIVREAFKDLLKAWGKQHYLVFIAEYPIKTATKSNVVAINHSAYLSNFIKLYKLFHSTPRRNSFIVAHSFPKANFEELPRSSPRYFER